MLLLKMEELLTQMKIGQVEFNIYIYIYITMGQERPRYSGKDSKSDFFCS